MTKQDLKKIEDLVVANEPDEQGKQKWRELFSKWTKELTDGRRTKKRIS